MFRHPKDSTEFNFKFYQQNYTQEDGITTDLPSKEELEILKQNNFKGKNKNVDFYNSVFLNLFSGKNPGEIKLVDTDAAGVIKVFNLLKRDLVVAASKFQSQELSMEI